MPINIQSILTIKAQASESLTNWLHYQSSLTDKLQNITGDAHLELMSQQWISTDWWGKNFLQIQDEMVFQREIIMKSYDVAYWYARSIIPQKCYNQDPFFFDRLKNESIKNLIFGNNRVKRIHWFTYPIDQQAIEFHWVKKYINSVKEVLWVRLTEFCFQDHHSFYLIEILLPEIEKIIL